MIYYYEVVFNLPLRKTFTYSSKIETLRFKRVRTSFKNKSLVGLVLTKAETSSSFTEGVKEILEVIDEKPVLSEQQYKMALWLQYFYLCSLGEALGLFISFNKNIDKIKTITTKDELFKKEEKSKIKAVKLEKKISLTSEQQEIFDEITPSLKQFNYYFIHGVTGSGKTFLYLSIAQEVINKNRQVLILLPEVAMVLELEKLVKNFFPEDEYVSFYGKLSSKKKIEIKRKVETKKNILVIGTRSSLFLSLDNLGLVVVDEEHDESYKNNKTPRYSTKVVAHHICRTKKIGLILVSATPSVETFYYAKTKKIKGFSLLKRFNDNDLPEITMVKTQDSQSIAKSISKKIYEKINKGEQVIVYLNQKGYSNNLSCSKCYEAIRCDNCDISLTYHQKKNRLSCHYCSRSYSIPSHCPHCNNNTFKYIKYGVEKIKKDLDEKFADYRIEQFDSDNLTSTKKMRKIINDFSEKKIDILVGTQMIIKGYNFKKVSLVVIFHPEKYLLLPDYKVNQRMISHLIQAGGRSGRDKIAGEVIVQTTQIDSYPLSIYPKLNQFENFEGFYYREAKARKDYVYPPFIRILRFIFRGKDRDKVEATTLTKEKEIQAYFVDEDVTFLAAGPCLIGKIDKNYRWNIIVKITDLKKALEILNRNMEKVLKRIPASIYMEIDLDPVDLY